MQTDEAHAEPDRLAFDEKINVVVAITRECARAEQHDDADDQHAKHCEKQDVSALAMHRRSSRLLARTSSPFVVFAGIDQFLSNLKFVRIIDVIQRHRSS